MFYKIPHTLTLHRVKQKKKRCWCFVCILYGTYTVDIIIFWQSKVFSISVWITWEKKFIYTVVPSKPTYHQVSSFPISKESGRMSSSCTSHDISVSTGRGRTFATCLFPRSGKSNQSCANSDGAISSSYFNRYRTKCRTGIKITYFYFEFCFSMCVFRLQDTLWVYWLPIEWPSPGSAGGRWWNLKALLLSVLPLFCHLDDLYRKSDKHIIFEKCYSRTLKVKQLAFASVSRAAF